jgi:hypothetical protein
MRPAVRGQGKLMRAAATTASQAKPSKPVRGKRRGPRKRSATAQLRLFFEYAADMEEPLNEALDLARGLTLVGDGLNATGNRETGRPVLALGRRIAGELAQVKGMLATLLKAGAELP